MHFKPEINWNNDCFFSTFSLSWAWKRWMKKSAINQFEIVGNNLPLTSTTFRKHTQKRQFELCTQRKMEFILNFTLLKSYSKKKTSSTWLMIHWLITRHNKCPIWNRCNSFQLVNFFFLIYSCFHMHLSILTTNHSVFLPISLLFFFGSLMYLID